MSLSKVLPLRISPEMSSALAAEAKEFEMPSSVLLRRYLGVMLGTNRDAIQHLIDQNRREAEIIDQLTAELREQRLIGRNINEETARRVAKNAAQMVRELPVAG